jgi:type I restriction enzyme, S subunit
MSMFQGSPWPLMKLSSICGGKEVIDPTRTPDQEFSYVDIASVSNETFQITAPKRLVGRDAPSRARKRVRVGDVVVATTRPYLKSIARVPQDLDGEVCSTGFCVLRPTQSVTSDWLFFCSQSADFIGQLTACMRGANYPAVTDRDVLGASIPLPPISDQERIASRIRECMERVVEIEKESSSIARELDALFPALLNERFAEIQIIHGSRSLEDVAEIRGGGSLPKGTDNDSAGSSILLVKVGDMNAEGNERTITTARECLARFKAKRGVIDAGAVIFPKRGGAIATNKKRLLGRPALIDPNLMALVAKPRAISPDYLYFWCQTLDLSKLSNGGVIPQLNRKDLAPLEVPVPDGALQAKIVEELKRFEEYCFQLKTEFVDAQTERAHVREAILRKAFTGEL